MMLRRVKLYAASLVVIVVWLYAAYQIGYTRGRGWRGAVLDAGCVNKCLYGP